MLISAKKSKKQSVLRCDNRRKKLKTVDFLGAKTY
jgi:hypothetical protein